MRLSPALRLLLIALVVRVVPAALVYGTDDVGGWETWGRMLASGQNPYASKYLIAWPPFWLPVVWSSYLTADATGLPFSFLAKLTPIAADLIIVFLLDSAAGRRAGLAYALNPFAIYTSAIHGNFDAIPLLCLTASMLRADRGDARAAGAWLGLGGAFKSWPLLFLPAILAPLQTFRERVRAALPAMGIFAGALLLTFPFGWTAVTGVLGYRSIRGWWGISSIAFLLGVSIPDAATRGVFYGAMAVVALLVLARRDNATDATLLLLLTFFVTTPGFGMQYLVWLVPAALLVDRRRALIYSILGVLLIASELVARPFAGHAFDTVRLLPHTGYARAIGGRTDQLYAALGRLVVWAYLCWWWLAALSGLATRARIRAPKLSRP